MAVNLKDTKIDPEGDQYQTMLRNLQGNILKGHGRNYTIHIFIELRGEVADVRERLASIAGRFVSSALQQYVESKQFKKYGIPGGIFGNLFLTAKGYHTLGFSDEQMEALFEEGAAQPYFRDGMRAHREDLSDPPKETWEEGYSEGRADAMLLLADDDENYLLRRVRDIINELDDFADVLVVERGKALRNHEGEGIEHFGYADGRSQPIFFKGDLADEGATDKWDPAEPLELALVPDKSVPGAEDAFGSYFVFRKLEQDVLRFTVREHALADEMGLTGTDRERAGAMAVGRFRDGTPLALSQTDGFLPTKENNFTYAQDSEGLKCPFHAHIRKSNPRGDVEREHGIPEQQGERSKRVVRRGITYGDRIRHPNAFQALDDLPTKNVGLLFMCFQASIANQFAFIQQRWVNAENFLRGGTGLDPIIGQTNDAGNEEPTPQKWPLQWGLEETKAASFGSFVTLKGGEFFFAPSLPFLKTFAPPTTDE